MAQDALLLLLLLAEEQQRNAQHCGGSKAKGITFVNAKSYVGGKFSGTKAKNFKAWTKRIKVYCNTQCRGFRQAINIEKTQSTKINIA